MKNGNWARRGCLALVVIAYGTVQSFASPWAEVGDNQLRGDIEILAAAGVIDDITMHWPLPWQSIVKDLRDNSLEGQPASVRAAAARVLARARAENRPGLSASLDMDATNLPNVVYGFDGMGRGDGQGQFILDFNSQDTAARLALGGFTQNFRGNSTKLMPDESYLAEKFGPMLLYGGYLSHWWGPGQISALQLSNNARPMPQIGIERADTSASSWPVLRWLGPWEWEFFVARLDGPQIQPDVDYNAMHLTINPAPGLEIGVARTEEFCGKGHPCSPIKDYFHFTNAPGHSDNTHDEASWEIKYGHTLGGVPFQVYMQLMNRDYSFFNHSDTNYLFGTSVFLPTNANPVKLTAEFTDSISTKNPFAFNDPQYGITYNDYKYPDGMHYRDRSIGFSLDTDSQLLALQGSWSDALGRFYELSLYHANISNIHSPEGSNILTPVPVTINQGEARVTLPFRWMKLDLAGRLQDNQLYPHHGFAASFETGLRIGL